MKPPKILKKILDISVGKYLKINIWTIPMLVISILGEYGQMFILAYLSSAMHELCHILCAKALKVGISYVHIYPFGISARLKSEYIKSSEKELLIALSGPLCSLCLFWIFLYLKSSYPLPAFHILTDINLSLCAINMLPCLPLDGGRAVKAILTSRYGIIRAYNAMLKFSRLSVIALIVFSIFVIFVSNFNFSLILISAFLLQNLAFEQQAISIVTLKEILKSREKAENAESLATKILSVPEDKTASGILRHLSYDYFCVINVLNKDYKIIRALTEVQVIDAIIKSGIRIKYKDIK